MKLYILRAIRYVLRIAVILAIVFIVLHFTGTLDTGGRGLTEALFMSGKGLILIAVLLVLAAIYPKLAFAQIELSAPGADDRTIADAFASIGYERTGESGGATLYRAKSGVSRLLASYNDTVRVTRTAEGITLEGMKKDVARVASRIQHFAGL